MEEELEREFDLAIILTATTGYNLLDSFDDFYKFLYFVFDDDYMNSSSLESWDYNRIISHLLTLYPKLSEVKYKWLPKEQINKWVAEQKAIYGESLLVSKYDKPLSVEKHVKE